MCTHTNGYNVMHLKAVVANGDLSPLVLQKRRGIATDNEVGSEPPHQVIYTQHSLEELRQTRHSLCNYIE